jgi:prepilin-type N-terminal cleavage/methylation domain-containing protein
MKIQINMDSRSLRDKFRGNDRAGLTLIELLMAVWVMGVILTAVAALSFALGAANDSADNSSEIYSRVRYATMRVNELLRSSKLICSNSGTSVAIWRADDNGDNRPNPGEMVYIEATGGNINLVSFKPTSAQSGIILLLSDILGGSTRAWLGATVPSETVTLVNNCSYITFTTDAAPPYAKKLNIYFGISQKGVSREYQITAQQKCYAGYLLNGGGTIKSTDDDVW